MAPPNPPTYKRVSLSGRIAVNVRHQDMGKLAPGEPARAGPLHGLMRSQDDIPAVSRRVLARQSLEGSDHFRVSDGGAMDQSNYPEHDVQRLVYEGQFQLAPGCFPAVSVVYVPSGGVWIVSSEGQSAQGLIIIETDWVNFGGGEGGGTDTTIAKIPLLGSPIGDFGEEPDKTIRGALFNAFIETNLRLMIPDSNFADVTELAGWCDGTQVTVRIYHLGGVRNVDTILYEVPVDYARLHSRTTWPAHVYSASDSNPPPQYPSLFPIEERDNTSVVTERRFGTRQVMDVGDRQGDQLGPTLIRWTAYNEALQDDIDLNADDFDPMSTASTSYINLINLSDGLTTYEDTEPGWSFGCYGRDFPQGCEPALRDKDGSIPVFIFVRAHSQAGASNDDARVRIQASEDSYVEIAIPGLAPGADPVWYSTQAHMRCGINPEDDSVVQAFFKADAAAQLDVYNISIYWGGTDAA